MNNLKENRISNRYRIGKQVIANIVIFRNGERLLDVGRPWLEARRGTYGSEIIFACDAITGMDVPLRRKLDLNRQEHFLLNEGASHGGTTGKTLFLWAGAFQHCSEPRELLDIETVQERNFLKVVDVTACWNGEASPRTVTIAATPYIRTEETAFGQQCAALAQVLQDAGLPHASSYHAERLLRRSDELLALLGK